MAFNPSRAAVAAAAAAAVVAALVVWRPWRPAAPVEVKREAVGPPAGSDREALAGQADRRSLIRGAFDERVDLSSMNKPSYKLGQALSLLQDIIRSKLETDVELRVNYPLFSDADKAKELLDESEIDSKLFRTMDGTPLRDVSFGFALGAVLRPVAWTFRSHPDWIEIVPRPTFEIDPEEIHVGRAAFFRDALNQTVDLSSMQEPTYKLGKTLAILQDIINAKMKTKAVRQELPPPPDSALFQPYDVAMLDTEIKFYLNDTAFPKEIDVRAILAETMGSSVLKTVNENEPLSDVTFKAVLENVLRQAKWTFKITPDFVEIIPLPSSDKDLTTRQEERVTFIQSAMKQQVDLTSLGEQPQYKLGFALTILQDLISAKMKRDVKLYVNYGMFPSAADTKTMLKEADVDMDIFKKVNGGKMPRTATFGPALDTVLRQANWTFRITPDYVEIIPLPHE